jgi:hypothetical protein
MEKIFTPSDWLLAAALDYATVARYHAEGLATDEQLDRARGAYLDFGAARACSLIPLDAAPHAW